MLSPLVHVNENAYFWVHSLQKLETRKCEGYFEASVLQRHLRSHFYVCKIYFCILRDILIFVDMNLASGLLNVYIF